MYREYATLLFVSNVDGALDDRAKSDGWATTNGQACRSGRTYTTKYQFGDRVVVARWELGAWWYNHYNRVNWGLQLLSLTHSLNRLQFHTPVFDSASRKHGRGRSGSVVRPFRMQENTATGEPMAEGWSVSAIRAIDLESVATRHTHGNYNWPTIYYHRVNTLCLRHLHTMFVMRAALPGWLIITSAETLSLVFYLL